MTHHCELLKQLITCLKIKSRCSTLMFVPFQQRKKSDDVNANELTLVFKTRIKMFYRPAHLKGRVNDAWKSLEFKRSDHSLNIYNPTEYYVVFAGLAVDKTDLTSKIEYIAPGEHKQLPLPASGGKNVKWAAINDYGGSSGTETRPLQ